MTSIPLGALAAETGVVSGTVHTADGAPIGGAAVSLRGAATLGTTTDAAGAFTIANVPPGEYTLLVSKASFQEYRNDTVLVFIGENESLAVTLVPVSFSGLRTIATVSTNAAGQPQMNTSSAAVTSISNQVFQDQGVTQVTKILNETPGIISAASPENGNGASAGALQSIQIRGALPYETEQLIDGHPTALSLGGTYNPIYLNPLLLDSIEIVKGPGAMPEEINYAIGGTVNYVTLQPTRTNQSTLLLGSDNWGGITTALRATGSTKTHWLDYALGFATDGAPGPLRNYPIAGSQINLVAGLGAPTINGQQIAQSVEGFGLYPPTSNYAGIGGLQFYDPLYICCYDVNTAYYSRNELAKLRFNLSPFTSLTVSYLGAQAFSNVGGVDLTSLSPIGTDSSSFSVFEPCANGFNATPPACPGYTGSVAPGTSIPYDLEAFIPQYESVQQNLFQAEFRTSFGNWAMLGRYFSGSDTDYAYIQTAPDGSLSFSGATYGGIMVCPSGATYDPATGACSSGAPTTEYFSGQTATLSVADATNEDLEQDHLRGESLLFTRPFGNGDDVSFSIDQAHHDSLSYTDDATAGPPFFGLPPGAGQNFTTEMVRGHFYVAPRVFLGLANYGIQYSSHYTDNGGATWQNATRGYDAPRMGLTWAPNNDTTWRLGAGFSIAPPELSLLSSPGTTPLPNINGAPTYYTENLNNGAIAPETAFGVDLGVDRRLDRSTLLSADVYDETLRNEFLSSTSLIGTYVPPGVEPPPAPLPLYATETSNLGHARYAGLEVMLEGTPLVGWGYRIQGDLQRAYAYDLPPYFYCSVPGPGCTPNTNLGILPNANWNASGLGFNTVNGSAVPYMMGYAEVNYRTPHGTYYLFGSTYYGENNTFSLPPFFIFNAAIREPLRPGTNLQLSVDNIFDTYGSSWTNYFGGINAPLLPGTGLVGLTVGGNYGPTSVHVELIQNLGSTPH
ncbi:MAG TPA: TonB-dependent receptor [Candidatus Baltobacteraceae bacterium]|nr:TonB-dependent receptor [Candidatus Baltobacteraceae bacterium]